MARVICKGGNTGDWTVELSHSHIGGVWIERFSTDDRTVFIITKPHRADMKKKILELQKDNIITQKLFIL